MSNTTIRCQDGKSNGIIELSRCNTHTSLYLVLLNGDLSRTSATARCGTMLLEVVTHANSLESLSETLPVVFVHEMEVLLE